MAEALVKDGKTYLPLERGSPIDPQLLVRAEWGQKTAPTKIYPAHPGEDIGQASGERKMILAKGNEIIFDNGDIPITFSDKGNVIQSRRDIFIPTKDGKPIGAEVRDRDYRQVSKGVEQVIVPAFNGGEGWARDYGIYLPLPNPQAVVRFDYPVYLPNAFGENDHQWLDQPVIRLEETDGAWRVKGAVNGPEFNATWTTFAPLAKINREEAKINAALELAKVSRRLKFENVVDLVKSLPVRLAFSHWRSRPERHRPG